MKFKKSTFFLEIAHSSIFLGKRNKGHGVRFLRSAWDNFHKINELKLREQLVAILTGKTLLITKKAYMSVNDVVKFRVSSTRQSQKYKMVL